MTIRVRVAGSGMLVAWKVPWPDIFLTEERLLSAVSPLGDMGGMPGAITRANRAVVGN